MKLRHTRTYKLFRQTKTKVLNVSASLVLVSMSLGSALPALLTRTATALSTTEYSQNFSSGVGDWQGAITSTGGVATAADGSSPYTFFGGAQGTWQGNFTASVDVYLDPSWAAGSGFDYSVESRTNNGTSTGTYGRDYIAHVTKDTSTGQLLFGASNNSSDSTPDETLENGDHYTVSSAGWYTIRHTFRYDNGVLAVDVSLLNAGSSTPLFTKTLSAASDLIPSVVGGHGYGWFTFVDVPGGLKLDNVSLVQQTIDAPTNLSIVRNNANITGTTINNFAADVVLNFDAVAGADQYITHVTYPGGSANLWNSYHNTWLVKNGAPSQGQFGAHGDGTYTYTVQARDAVTGEWSAWSNPVSLTYDTTAPAITSITANGSPVALDGSTKLNSASGITFEVMAADPAGYGYTYVELNTGTPSYNWKAANTGAFDTTLVTPASQYVDGKVYGLKICPTDKLGNGTCTQVAFTIDNTAPAVPTDLSWLDANHHSATNDLTNVQTGTLSWKDSDPSVDHYLYKFWTNIPGYHDGMANAWTTEDPSYFTTSSTGGSIWTNFYDDEGTYSFCVAAVDAIGNTSACSDTYTVTYDKTAPDAPTLVSPQDNAVVNGASITQSWSDTSNDVDHYIYESYSDAAATQLRWHEEFTGTSKTATNVANATYWWRVKAVDAAGNESPWSELRKITVDNTKPSTPTNGAPNNTYETTDDFWFTWSGSTDNVGLNTTNSYELIASQSQSALNNAIATGDVSGVWDSVHDGASSGQYPLTSPTDHSTGAGDGTWYWAVRAIDQAGNTSDWSDVWNVTLDTHAPVVTLTAPQDGDTVNGTVTIKGSVTDAHPDHYYLVVKDDTGHVVAGPGTVNTATVADYDWDTTALTDGTYTIDLEARDAAGNKDAASVQTMSVHVDNTAPTVTIDGYTGTDTTPTLTGTVDDPAATITVAIDGSTAAAATNNGDGTWSFTVPAALTSGNHHVVVTASDTIGNTYQTTASITVTDDSQTGGSGSGSGSGSGNQSGTTGGNQSTVTVTPNNDGHVLGDTTDTSDTDSKGKIKGDKTVNIATAADKHAGNFLGLGWWWLLFVAILAGGWWFLAAKRRKQDEN